MASGTDVIRKGCYVLGSACGNCRRCAEERSKMAVFGTLTFTAGTFEKEASASIRHIAPHCGAWVKFPAKCVNGGIVTCECGLKLMAHAEITREIRVYVLPGQEVVQ